jgi:hypothetical protein
MNLSEKKWYFSDESQRLVASDVELQLADDFYAIDFKKAMEKAKEIKVEELDGTGQKVFSVIITGTGLFTFPEFRDYCDKVLQNKDKVMVVCGNKDLDEFSAKYARLRGHLLKEIKLDWDNDGKRAGYAMMDKLLCFGDAAIVFNGGGSAWIDYLIKKLNELKIPTRLNNTKNTKRDWRV